MKGLKSVINRCFVVCVAVLLAFQVNATTAEPEGPAIVSPDELIRQATVDVLSIIDNAKGYYDQDPERYFNEISLVIDRIVDFQDFSRAVMGPFASEKRLASLSETERAELEGQIVTFASVFKEGLVKTYGKGFLAFGGTEFKVNPARFNGDETAAEVVQEVFGSGDKTYKVRYTMGRQNDGAWVVRNVIIEAVNLGKVYRNQFMGAVRTHNGDLNAVIDNWTVTDAVDE